MAFGTSVLNVRPNYGKHSVRQTWSRKPKNEENEMRGPTLRIDWESGEGDVRFPEEWNNRSTLFRADVLGDWISILQDEYLEVTGGAYFTYPPKEPSNMATILDIARAGDVESKSEK